MHEKLSPFQEFQSEGNAMSNAYFTPEDSRLYVRELLERIVGAMKHKPSLAIPYAARVTKLGHGTVKALWYAERAVVPWELVKNLEIVAGRIEALSAAAEADAQDVRERGRNGINAALVGLGFLRNRKCTGMAVSQFSRDDPPKS